jgi:hypothetical protein
MLVPTTLTLVIEIYNAFKKLCGTLDDHKSIFAIFPSQNNYASVLCASLSCLVKVSDPDAGMRDDD